MVVVVGGAGEVSISVVPQDISNVTYSCDETFNYFPKLSKIVVIACNDVTAVHSLD